MVNPLTVTAMRIRMCWCPVIAMVIPDEPVNTLKTREIESTARIVAPALYESG